MKWDLSIWQPQGEKRSNVCNHRVRRKGGRRETWAGACVYTSVVQLHWRPSSASSASSLSSYASKLNCWLRILRAFFCRLNLVFSSYSIGFPYCFPSAAHFTPLPTKVRICKQQLLEMLLAAFCIFLPTLFFLFLIPPLGLQCCLFLCGCSRRQQCLSGSEL